MDKDSNFRVELLDHTHNVTAFFSSEPAVTAFLTDKAMRYQTEHACSVYLILDIQDNVLGFFTLSNFSVTREKFSGTQARKYFVNPIPAVLIGQLARDIKHTVGGFGRKILGYAFEEALRRNEWQLVCVDPFSPESRDWFISMDFQQTTIKSFDSSPDAPAKLPQLYKRRVDIEASILASKNVILS
jgi:hypothetical protein